MDPIFERYQLVLEAYQPEFIQKLVKIYQTQSNIDVQNATWYIKRFDQLRTSKAADIQDKVKTLNLSVRDPLDIKTYTWNDLEKIVDQFQDTRIIKNNLDTSKDLIYDQNNLQIFLADSQEKCIKHGEGTTFCVSRPGGGNLYNNYRFKDNLPTFYFVKDLDKDKSNDLSIFAIQVDKNKDYVITLRSNNDEEDVTWQQIEQTQPKLRGLQQLFVWKDLTDQEKDKQKCVVIANTLTVHNLHTLSYNTLLKIIRYNIYIMDGVLCLLPSRLIDEYVSQGHFNQIGNTDDGHFDDKGYISKALFAKLSKAQQQ